jgi:hypothetical protein
MISIGPLFIILVIHWELVKWTSRFDLVTVATLCWRIVTKKLKKSPHFAHSLEKFMTHHKQSAADDQHRTTVHHSCDPLGAGEMDPLELMKIWLNEHSNQPTKQPNIFPKPPQQLILIH